MKVWQNPGQPESSGAASDLCFLPLAGDLDCLMALYCDASNSGMPAETQHESTIALYRTQGTYFYARQNNVLLTHFFGVEASWALCMTASRVRGFFMLAPFSGIRTEMSLPKATLAQYLENLMGHAPGI